MGWEGRLSSHSRQTLSTNSFVGFKSITASTFRSCLLHLSLSLSLSLSLYNFPFSILLLFSSLIWHSSREAVRWQEMSPGKTGSIPQDRIRWDLNWKLSSSKGMLHTWMVRPPACPKYTVIVIQSRLSWRLHNFPEFKEKATVNMNLSDLFFPVSICIDQNAHRIHGQYIFIYEIFESLHLAGDTVSMIPWLYL